MATMLSPQTKDQQTNDAFHNLLALVLNKGNEFLASSLAKEPLETIEQCIMPVSFYKTKARNIHLAAVRIDADFGNDIPRDIDALLGFKGVGPKVAYLTFEIAWGKSEGICVDTHVHRIANRLGWVRTDPALAGASVVVAHYRNELPMYKEVETILKDGLLGHIKSVNIRIWQAKGESDGGWRVDPAVSGGGYFHDLAPHVLALMYKWFGSFHNARGQQLKSEGNIVDQVTGMATFDNSIQFTASWCFSVPPCQEVDECLIVGQYGSLRVPFFKGSHFDLNLDDSDGRKTHYEYEHPYNIQQPFIHAMMMAFRGRTDIPCSIDDAIAVMDVMDAFAQD